MDTCGILLGADLSGEWLLPWFWEHYTKANSYPVAFVDFGMSEFGIEWCQKYGTVVSLKHECSASKKEDLPQEIVERWEIRHGESVWSVRDAWMKKPFALQSTPFDKTIWIDNDCMVKGSLAPLFEILDTYDLAAYEDTSEKLWLSPDAEPHYNSGVVAYKKNTPFLKQLHETALTYEAQLPGDEEILGKAIHTYAPKVYKLPLEYNCQYDKKSIKEPTIIHYSTGPGKLEIMQMLPQSYYQGVGIPKQKL